jgi:septum formation protein
MSRSPFWLGQDPLVLASGSATRRLLLENATIPFEVSRPVLDEAPLAAALVDQMCTPHEIALALAHAKAEEGAARHPGRVVLASDQTLDFDGALGMKPTSRAQAKGQLERLCGHTHVLHSAAVLRRDQQILWAGSDQATLQMRAFSARFLAHYLATMGDDVLESVGCYKLEGLGIQLFERIDGEHATILGLPLSQVLQALRAHDLLMR